MALEGRASLDLRYPPLLIAIGVQSFALLGTMVGLLTIAIGVGPRTVLDLTLHTVMLLLLVSGLVAAVRMARK